MLRRLIVLGPYNDELDRRLPLMGMQDEKDENDTYADVIAPNLDEGRGLDGEDGLVCFLKVERQDELGDQVGMVLFES